MIQMCYDVQFAGFKVNNVILKLMIKKVLIA